ncbi:MAG: hypothetical protein KBD16_02040 [Candidatus Pacebacteria bacterium]|nr:hypothetical protein [Candidatus Paceibacterota bacterium]
MKIGRNVIFISLLACIPFMALGQIRQSTNYQIVSDSLDSGGGLGTSTNYQTESSVGEQATGFGTSTNYTVHAGYQQLDAATSSISISAGSDAALAAISGLAGGTSKATSSWTVITDNNAGYTLTIEATSSPALKGANGAGFGDYVTTGADPDFIFSVNAASSTFGFSPEGTHIPTRFKDNGSVCNTGTGDTADRCYVGLSTSPEIIAVSGSANAPEGTLTTARFAAGIGTSRIQESGAYTATIVVTAIAQ